MENLEKHELPTAITAILRQTCYGWKRLVKEKIEMSNMKRLYEECHTKVNNQTKVKTKTASIIESLNQHEYTRTPCEELLTCSKHETKTILIALYSMLECGNNFPGTQDKTCRECEMIDNEYHRLNNCKKYRQVNYYDSDQKVDFNLVYSRDIEIIKQLVPMITKVWNTKKFPRNNELRTLISI